MSGQSDMGQKMQALERIKKTKKPVPNTHSSFWSECVRGKYRAQKVLVEMAFEKDGRSNQAHMTVVIHH